MLIVLVGEGGFVPTRHSPVAKSYSFPLRVCSTRISPLAKTGKLAVFLLTTTILPKQKAPPFSGAHCFGGRGWIRTTEARRNRFTVCPLWPLGNSPKSNVSYYTTVRSCLSSIKTDFFTTILVASIHLGEPVTAKFLSCSKFGIFFEISS